MSRQKNEKQIWLWSGVTIVMAALLFFWISSLPQQLKIKSSTTNLEKELFNKSTDQLSTLITEQKEQTENLKNIIKESLASQATSTLTTSSTITLTAQQIEEIKNKIEKK